MKKIISALLALACTLSFTACGSAMQENMQSTSSASGSSAAALQEEMPWPDIEPLDAPVTLNVAQLANTLPHLPTYIAQQKGWLDAVGIEVNSVVFKNGPAMMEAVGAGSWDCGSTGIGGVITGVLNQDIKVIGVAARDEGGFQAFFARAGQSDRTGRQGTRRDCRIVWDRGNMEGTGNSVRCGHHQSVPAL